MVSYAIFCLDCYPKGSQNVRGSWKWSIVIMRHTYFLIDNWEIKIEHLGWLASPPASHALSQVLCKGIVHIPQIITYAVREKGMEQNGEQTKVSLAWCKHWSCCSLQKGTSLNEVEKNHFSKHLSSEEIKPVSLAIIELCLSEGIH